MAKKAKEKVDEHGEMTTHLGYEKHAAEGRNRLHAQAGEDGHEQARDRGAAGSG